MRSVHKIILVGNVAANPDLHQIAKGTTVTTPVATSRDVTPNGKRKVTDYHRVVAWGKLADICGKYLEKGKSVYVEGMVINRPFEKEGENQYVTEIRAEEVNILTFKKNRDREQITIDAPNAE